MQKKEFIKNAFRIVVIFLVLCGATFTSYGQLANYRVDLLPVAKKMVNHVHLGYGLIYAVALVVGEIGAFKFCRQLERGGPDPLEDAGRWLGHFFCLVTIATLLRVFYG